MRVTIVYGDRRPGPAPAQVSTGAAADPGQKEPQERRGPAPLLETGALVAATLVPRVAQAAVNPSTTDLIMRAFDPLIDLVQAVSYPLCFLMVSGGCLLMMVGHRARGLDMMRWAAVGYILLQLVPAVMRVLVEVGQAMRQAQQVP